MKNKKTIKLLDLTLQQAIAENIRDNILNPKIP